MIGCSLKCDITLTTLYCWSKHILFRYKVHRKGLGAAKSATLPFLGLFVALPLTCRMIFFLFVIISVLCYRSSFLVCSAERLSCLFGMTSLYLSIPPCVSATPRSPIPSLSPSLRHLSSYIIAPLRPVSERLSCLRTWSVENSTFIMVQNTNPLKKPSPNCWVSESYVKLPS